MGAGRAEAKGEEVPDSAGGGVAAGGAAGRPGVVMADGAQLGGEADVVAVGGPKIASFSSAAQVWVPGVVRRLREQYPGSTRPA